MKPKSTPAARDDAQVTTQHQDRLRAAVDDSSLLVAFLSATKRDIAPELIQQLVDAQDAYRQNPELDAATEAAFWQAFSVAASAAQPATVEGIRDVALNRSLGFFGWMIKFPWIALPSVVALVLYLLFQIHVVSGSTILTRFEATLASLDTASHTTPRPDDRIAILSDNLDRLTGLLNRWNNCPTYPVSVVCFSSSPGESNDAALKAQIWLDTMNSYVLPLILGLLGACTQVLRSIARRVIDQSMLPELLPAYYVRLVLGIIVGATIGLFITPDKTGDAGSPLSFFSTLPLLTTAFLAGYAVEIFFALLDRFIGDARNYIAGKPQEESKPKPK